MPYDILPKTMGYELQKNHYADLISRHPGWNLVNIYADERNAMLIRYIWLRIVIVTNMQ